MKFKNLEELFVAELRDMYDAEKQLVKALPKMAKAASSSELRAGFQHHLEQTKTHVTRLEEVFKQVEQKPKAETCAAMKGLVEEGEEIASNGAEEHARDAGLIAAAQKVEHYEIASYGTLLAWARHLGHHKASELLQQTLNEEKQTDQKLTSLAESFLNEEARTAAAK